MQLPIDQAPQKVSKSSSKYNPSDPLSIESYGKRLLGKSLRSVPGVIEISQELLDKHISSANRSGFGALLEKYYYGITEDAGANPDFREAQVELKATPLKVVSNGEYRAKERLVLNMINYVKEANEQFASSSFMHKASMIMLVAYLHQTDRFIGDLKVCLADLIKFENLPVEDQLIIEKDWNLINAKIRNSLAHELSEGDTLYLAACTKGRDATSMRDQYNSSVVAKQRAYSFKQSYMNILLSRLLHDAPSLDLEPIVKNAQELKENTLENIIASKYKPYIGLSITELTSKLNIAYSGRKDKGLYAQIARYILGVKKKKVEEFEKADICQKTIRIDESGMPAEHMSFPAFKYRELASELWDADEDSMEIPSTFRKQLQKRFLFVIYRYNSKVKSDENLILEGVKFWTMPNSDLQIVREEWEAVVEDVKQGKNEYTRASETKISHVRPHGRDGRDTDLSVTGEAWRKNSFWLNREYVKEVLGN